VSAMNYFYIAVSVEENGKHYAYIIKASESDNMLSKLKIKNIEHANIYKTKKKASEVVSRWNAVYKTNGVYMFDNPAF
jgi:hypothetical protein